MFFGEGLLLLRRKSKRIRTRTIHATPTKLWLRLTFGGPREVRNNDRTHARGIPRER